MLTRKISSLCTLCNKRYFHKSLVRNYRDEGENPLSRTARILAQDLKRFFQFNEENDLKSKTSLPANFYPNHADIVIIGGGAIGSSVAYWLKEQTNVHSLRVIVIEKDTTYSKCSTTLSVGGLRQQFSLPENILMSLYGAEFIRKIKDRFGPDADVNFTPHGDLVLASEEGAEQLIKNSRLQNELGAVNVVLNKKELKERFPWMNVSNVELGCYGLEKEGWFDPWSLLTLLKRGAADLGAQYMHGEVVDFLFEDTKDVITPGVKPGSIYEKLRGVVVKMPDGKLTHIEFAICVLAAGAESGKIAELAQIGMGKDMLSIPLPVERRKRYVYSFTCKDDPPGLNTPLTIDYSGAYFRRDGLGGKFICGLTPPPEEEPPTDNLDVDYKYFDEKVWPTLANRVPAFNSIKLNSAWGGFYEYNTFDENGFLGTHPYYYNLMLATGFSGHGIQQAPAIGRAISELILDGGFQTINLSRFNFDRMLANNPLCEIGIY